MVLWLLLWAFSDWRSRRRFIFGFGLIMLLLLAEAQYVLPGWIGMFVTAIRQYHAYTKNQSVLISLFGSILGRVLEGLSALACAACVWPLRRESASRAAFGRAFGLVLALTVVIVPMFAPYNQVLLAPAILALLWSESAGDSVLPAVRIARAIGGILLVWPWIATVGLTLAYFWLTPSVRERVWTLPFYSNFMVPVFIFGLALLNTWTTREEPAA
jgi:hypothetical protein